MRRDRTKYIMLLTREPESSKQISAPKEKCLPEIPPRDGVLVRLVQRSAEQRTYEIWGDFRGLRETRDSRNKFLTPSVPNDFPMPRDDIQKPRLYCVSKHGRDYEN